MEKASYEVTRELKKSGVEEYLAYWNGKQMASAYLCTCEAYGHMDYMTLYDDGEKLIGCLVDANEAESTVYRMLSKLVLG